MIGQWIAVCLSFEKARVVIAGGWQILDQPPQGVSINRHQVSRKELGLLRDGRVSKSQG